MVKIPQKVIDQIIAWNTGPARDDVRYDERMVHLLLLSLVHNDQLCASVVSDDVMKFVEGLNIKYLFKLNHFMFILDYFMKEVHFQTFITMILQFFQHVSVFAAMTTTQINV